MTEWITWNGGKCPVEPETVVEVKLRDAAGPIGEAASRYWGWRGSPFDIVAYRVLDFGKSAPPPEKPFSSCITEAEEKALEAVADLMNGLVGLRSKSIADDAAYVAFDDAIRSTVQARSNLIRAAALARDYDRRAKP